VEPNNTNSTSKRKQSKIHVLDTKRRKATALSFLFYYFAISAVTGAPIPFPSLIDVTAEHVAFINFISLLITLVGSIIGVGFYVERRNNLKFDQQNNKIDRIDRKIDEKGNWLFTEMREMEGRICKSMSEKFTELERNTEFKIQKAEDVEDERFKRIDEQHRELQRRIDTIDRDSYEYKTRRYRQGGKE
jgi:hypothetical protein